MCAQKLKLGLLLDSFDVPSWVYSVIRRVVSENSGEFKLVILNNSSDKPIEGKKNVGVYSIFNRIDKKLFTKKPDPFSQKSVADLLSNVPILKVSPVQKGNFLWLGESAVENIREYKLDILVNFGFDRLQLETLSASKYGTWSYYHGDDRVMKGGPPGFWEVVEYWPETSSALIATGGKFHTNRVLFRSHFVTYPLSPARQRSYYFWATTSFLSRQLSLLQQHGEEQFMRETEKYNKNPLSQIKVYEPPSNIVALTAIGKIVARLIKEFIQRVAYTNQWLLLFNLENNGSYNFKEFIERVPPKGKFWADPHIINTNGSYYIFIEEFVDAKNKGHISVIESDELGNWKSPVKVLEKNYHLSYPFVFEWNKTYYMVPESRENRTIDLYECDDFPHRWKFKQSLMKNVSAVDTTLVRYENKWWLFTAIAENEAASPNVELFLFYSDSLFSGKWMAHPRNPIVSDVKRARPAGNLFLKDGKLFRPSQDCSRAYGYGFDLNEIEILSEKEYRERKIVSVRPDWDKTLLGTHTYAQSNNLTIIDALRRIPKFR